MTQIIENIFKLIAFQIQIVLFGINSNNFREYNETSKKTSPWATIQFHYNADTRFAFIMLHVYNFEMNKIFDKFKYKKKTFLFSSEFPYFHSHHKREKFASTITYVYTVQIQEKGLIAHTHTCMRILLSFLKYNRQWKICFSNFYVYTYVWQLVDLYHLYIHTYLY